MYFLYNRPKKVWQTGLIKQLFQNRYTKADSFTELILENLNWVNLKGEYLPNSLYKFYSPSPENLDDIANKKLWLADPTTFNDPFDCQIGYDEEKWEKACLLEFAKQNTDTDLGKKLRFTKKEIERIERSNLGDFYYWHSDIESYYDAKRKILDNKNKDLSSRVWRYLQEKKSDADSKVEELKKLDIRVSCFANLNVENKWKQIAMWSHYADNHQGFCVEYDISNLKKDIVLEHTFGSFNKDDERQDYLNERLEVITKAGLFPIQYTSSRVNVPTKMLQRPKDRMFNKSRATRNVNELIFKTYIVKSANWNYEKEWRIIVDNKVSTYFKNKLPFPYIKTIYAGCNSNDHTIDRLEEISRMHGIEFYLSQMNGGKFILEPYKDWERERRRIYIDYRSPFGYS